MTGDGTVNNPLIPTTWDEFVTAVGTANAYVELPESGGVFNMNTISPLGISEIDFKCRELQGNNWIIAYPFIRGTAWLKAHRSPTDIYRLHFVNMYSFNNEGEQIIKSTSGYTLKFYYCSFSGIIFNGSLTNYSYFYNCSFNIEVYNNININAAVIGLYSYFYDTRINIVGFHKTTTTSFYLYYCERCEITSKLGNKEIGFETAIGTNSGCKANKFNCSGITRLSVANTPVSNVINSDLNPDLDISSATGFTACTTEQINNAEYLRSIGFPIGVD